MITQAINLNLIPGQVLPRVNVSQYDSGTRTLQLSIFNGTQAFNITSGLSGFIQGTKPDRTGFQYAASVTVGSNVVTADITQQMTAVSGEVTCELVLANGSDRIATVNFIIYVEPAALADDTIISETDIPLIEEAAELAEQIETLVPEIEANAYKAEAYGAGTKDGDPVPSTDPAYHNNAKYYSEQAAASAASVGDLAKDSEAWAVGERGGVPVTSGDDTYHNNSKYYAGQASDKATAADTSASNANTDALKAEGYAIGKQNGTAVTSGSPYYHNNAEYYSGEASSSATNASTSEYNAGLSESAAAQSEEDSEAWAVGERNGVPVTSGDPTFQNNAKYYAQQAGSTALSALSDVTISSPQNGDTLEYNSTSQKWENSSQIQTLANLQNDLSNIDITGSTNNTGSTIPSDRYFYLNGTLVRAKKDIANGATLTENTNYEVVTAGALNDLSSRTGKLIRIGSFSVTYTTVTGDTWQDMLYKLANKALEKLHTLGNYEVAMINHCNFPYVRPDYAMAFSKDTTALNVHFSRTWSLSATSTTLEDVFLTTTSKESCYRRTVVFSNNNIIYNNLDSNSISVGDSYTIWFELYKNQ